MSVQIEHPTRFNYITKIIFQISLLLVFWWIGSMLQSLFKLPVSGAVIGLFIVLTGLLTGFFKLEWIKSGSDFILGELVLFFIPCFVGLIKYKHLFLTEGWQLIFAVILGTICVMVVTAYSVHIGFKFENKIKNHRSQSLRNIDLDGK